METKEITSYILCGHGYRTPQRKYGMIINREKLKKLGQNLLQCHVAHQNPHRESHGIELEAPW
jgi:hypothetical protein